MRRATKGSSSTRTMALSTPGLAPPPSLAQLILQSSAWRAAGSKRSPCTCIRNTAAKTATLGISGGACGSTSWPEDSATISSPWTTTHRTTSAMIHHARSCRSLLSGETVTATGHYYRVKNLRLSPALPEELRPGSLMSDPSPAGLAAAQRLGATAVKYPKRPEEESPNEGAQAWCVSASSPGPTPTGRGR